HRPHPPRAHRRPRSPRNCPDPRPIRHPLPRSSVVPFSDSWHTVTSGLAARTAIEITMTEAEWAISNDAVAMITALPALYADDLPLFKRMLHRYYLACCRAIWKLLPDEHSRNSVAVAERYLEGQADDADMGDADWYSEGAAFGIEYREDEVEEWIRQTE